MKKIMICLLVNIISLQAMDKIQRELDFYTKKTHEYVLVNLYCALCNKYIDVCDNKYVLEHHLKYKNEFLKR